MPQKEETIIVQELIDWIKGTGGDAFHVHGSAEQRTGEPDIAGFAFWQGTPIHLKVEVKTPTGTPSDIQLYRLARYHGGGYCAGIVTSKFELCQLIDDYYHWQDGLTDGISDKFLTKWLDPYTKKVYRTKGWLNGYK